MLTPISGANFSVIATDEILYGDDGIGFCVKLIVCKTHAVARDTHPIHETGIAAHGISTLICMIHSKRLENLTHVAQLHETVVGNPPVRTHSLQTGEMLQRDLIRRISAVSCDECRDKHAGDL